MDILKAKVGSLTHIKLSGHSYSQEVCAYIGEILKEATNITHVDFSDLFTGRMKDELYLCLKELCTPLMDKSLVMLDLSHNAFGPSGIPGFDFLLEQSQSLKSLRVMNCGLGPTGGKALAEAMAKGGLKLTDFQAGRNRLEDTGYTAIAGVIKDMGTLEKLVAPQNFVKKAGMLAMMDALVSNPDLTHIEIHDNWLKEEAITGLKNFITTSNGLIYLNISDCDIGGVGVKQIIRRLW